LSGRNRRRWNLDNNFVLLWLAFTMN
jgi:hypothetical protein